MLYWWYNNIGGKMKIINEEEYKNQVLNSNGVVVLDFFATWCMPCRMYSPVLEEVEEELNINIYKMDVDQCQNVPREYGVLSIPTICIFKNGKFIEKHIGFKTKEDLLELLQKIM